MAETSHRSRWASGPFVTTWVVSVLVGWGLAIGSIAWLTPSGWAPMMPALLMIGGLLLLSELRPIVMPALPGDPVSIAQAFVFATMYIWGPSPAFMLMAGSVLFGEFLERKVLWKRLFNVGQYTLSVGAGWLVLAAAGWQASPGAPKADIAATDLVAIVAAWIVYHLVNLSLVAGVSTVETSWWESFSEDFWFYTISTMAALALSPLIAVVAVAHPWSWTLLPVIMIPLLAVQRTAQMSIEREHRALHDPLTGLPNRQLLTDRIEVGLARAPRTGGRLVVIFLDLDLFKVVNDGLGHAVGDTLLVDVSHRLTGVVRAGDTLARFSGDEFAVVCEAIPDAEIQSLVGRIQDALLPPFSFGSHEVTITASIGVATATPGSTAQSLLREADSAMYRAKSAGRDQVAHFHQTMHDQATARLDDHLGLRRALERGELRAHYQPIVDLVTGEVAGMEALVRWEHPERGMIPPDQFIPLAEETGLILPLGAWMLEHALAQLQRWRQEVPEARNLWMAVNLSPRQLADPDLIHKISRSLRETGIPAASLHLEITETAVMRSLDRSTTTLEALRALGVRLIIDDFGTGYSSLARLKRLPVTALKVDRTFVDGLGSDVSDLSIVDAIINLADSLNLDVIAEGVETREQLEILQSLGAQMGQGYLWSRALPATDLAQWIRSVPEHDDLAEYRALMGR